MSEMSPQMQKAIAAAKAGKTAEAKVLLDRVVLDEPENANAWLLKSALSDSTEQQSEYLNKVLTIDPEHQVAKSGLAQLGEPVEDEPSEAMDEMAALLAEEPAPWPDESPVEQPADDFEQLFAEEEVDFAAETLRIDPDQTLAADDFQDFTQQSEADSVPAWLAEEGDFQEAAPLDGLDQQAPVAVEEELSEAEELPDWLQEETQVEFIPEDQPAEGEALALAAEQPAEALVLDEAVELELDEPLEQPKPAKKAKKSPTRIYEVILGILVILAVLVTVALVFVILDQPL